MLARVLGATEQLAATVAGSTIALTASRRRRHLPAGRHAALEDLVAKAATTMYAARAGGSGRVAFYSHPPRD